jgi:CubicO group peptidase (beta-lactamase class C family)
VATRRLRIDDLAQTAMPERHAGARGPRIDAGHWQHRLNVLAERHQIPGAALGILRIAPDRPDTLVTAACGVLNAGTGVPTTTDSVFQIGSITKVWTATLVMQLVDEGLLDLDAPIVEVLPEFRLADPEATKRVTMRHLLTHTSGIEGDVFTDTGRGDDCVEKYVALLADLPLNQPVGATLSYCNSGFSVAGLVIERLTRRIWDQALRERLFDPLGLEHTVTLPEQAILHRAAVGHLSRDGDEPVPAANWNLPRGNGPAGNITSSVADVLTFARLHLTGGLTSDGERLLSPESAAAMTDKHADVPGTDASQLSWGLGWVRYGWSGHRLVGHDGGTIGQFSYLRLLPEAGLAVVLLTNGGNTQEFYEDLFDEIFADLAGVTMPPPLAPPAKPPVVDLERHVGHYERAGQHVQVLVRDGGALLRITTIGPLAELLGTQEREMILMPLDDSGDLFAARQPSARTWIRVTFYELANGRRYVSAGRSAPKIA